MKKVLIMFLMVFSVGVLTTNAQTYYYKATSFAYKQMNSYGYWSNWSDWEYSDVLITINLQTDVVVIYSAKNQTYRITDFLRNFTDNSGGKQIEFRFIDQDGDIGSMRLRIERNGNSQLYIEFVNVIWCYNLVRTR
jgi:hypothetical protein